MIKLRLSINLESDIKGVAKYSSGRVHEYRIIQLLTRGFICGKLTLETCSLYSASAAPVSHCHRPLNKPGSALVCLSFCRYLRALLSQLETAAVLCTDPQPPGHSRDPFGCGRALTCPCCFAPGSYTFTWTAAGHEASSTALPRDCHSVVVGSRYQPWACSLAGKQPSHGSAVSVKQALDRGDGALRHSC